MIYRIISFFKKIKKVKNKRSEKNGDSVTNRGNGAGSFYQQRFRNVSKSLNMYP